MSIKMDIKTTIFASIIYKTSMFIKENQKGAILT